MKGNGSTKHAILECEKCHRQYITYDVQKLLNAEVVAIEECGLCTPGLPVPSTQLTEEPQE